MLEMETSIINIGYINFILSYVRCECVLHHRIVVCGGHRVLFVAVVTVTVMVTVTVTMTVTVTVSDSDGDAQ
jgi:hypothetical protein